ncbi:MAG: ROK family protein, partial [Candidatus Roizmanbacteria bacterium]|nr:ROK family protein [Candidatus Roizmanbacteria bacterium]
MAIPESVDYLTPEVFISDVLKLISLNATERFDLISKFSERAKEGLRSPIKEGPGPLMLRSHLSPPETPFKKLIGKKAIGIDIGGTNLRMGVGTIDENGQIRPDGKIKSKEIPIKYDSLDDFFEMLLKNGLEKLLRENPDLPLACIFSFPGSGVEIEDGIDIILGKNLPKEWEIGESAEKQLGKELNIFLDTKDKELERQKLPKLLKKKPFGKRKYLIDNDTVALIKDNQTDAGIVCASGYNWSIIVDKSLLGDNQGETGKTII